MSFFSGIKTFFSKFESEFVKIFRKAPQYEQTAAAVISYVAPVLQVILGLVDPPAAALVMPIINVIEADLATVRSVTTSMQVAPGTSALATVETALNGIKDNISGILQLSEVKNSAKQEQIKTEVSAVVDEVNALLNSLPKAA